MSESDNYPEHLSREELRNRLEGVKERISKVVSLSSIRIICVTKGFPVATVESMRELEVYDFGENYQQELSSKAANLEDVRWHFIGTIQRSKLKKIAEVSSAIHSLSRVSEIRDLARLKYQGEVFLQVRSDEEVGRNGFRLQELEEGVDTSRNLGLNLVGLMGIASITSGYRAPEFFRLVRDLCDRYGLKRCSMGMSDDFDVALANGATDLRLGRVLLGPRPTLRSYN